MGQQPKNERAKAARFRAGLTLIELLVVMAIMGILAGLLFPAVGSFKTKSKIQRAHLEMDQIILAVTEYQSAYGKFPVSLEAARVATELGEDMTFGGVIEETGEWVAGPGSYLTNNAEVMAVLLDLEFYGDGAPTINQHHARNPQRNRFLNAKTTGGTNAMPGVGVDGIYRDPWASPYVVAVDLNGDGRTRDFLYRKPAVSADSRDPALGLNGLVRKVDAKGNEWFEATRPVTVWSAGPDRHLSTTVKANEGVNRDNVVSWRR